MIVQNGQMYVTRDFSETLRTQSQLEAVLIWGPRQIGKTTLLDQLPLKSQLLLDDLSVRKKAQEDPAFVLDSLKMPCLIDEAQYAPNLFSEIKLRIDKSRRLKLKDKKSKSTQTEYYLKGSNRTLLDKRVKESLAGRCHIFSLHGLSVKELFKFDSLISIKTLFLKGGFPELYTRRELSVQQYLNDYIISFVEKDVASSAGIEKLNEFQTVLQLLAARTGQFINFSEVGALSGVESKTVQNWVEVLRRNHIVELLPGYSTNLSKRIIKMKKLFFYDVGLCSRLQGHFDEELVWKSPQTGSLFETLVFSEIFKTKINYLKDWQIYSWRTKDQNEIDFILESPNQCLFIESKLGIHGAKDFELDPIAKKIFSGRRQKVVVTSGGTLSKLSADTDMVPIFMLGEYLLENM